MEMASRLAIHPVIGGIFWGIVNLALGWFCYLNGSIGDFLVSQQAFIVAILFLIGGNCIILAPEEPNDASPTKQTAPRDWRTLLMRALKWSVGCAFSLIPVGLAFLAGC